MVIFRDSVPYITIQSCACSNCQYYYNGNVGAGVFSPKSIQLKDLHLALLHLGKLKDLHQFRVTRKAAKSGKSISLHLCVCNRERPN